MAPIDIEQLLAHRPFVSRLARRLVGDPARAEDVVQETYLAALRNPPRHAGALRAWLATVARKLAWTQLRSERRRAKREHDREPPPPAPTPADVVERAEWHRRLVNLLMELEEPYRGTLLLRFFEDLNSTEIARVHGVPAATVRTRLRRGLEQLRARLDDDGRARWLAGLALLAWPGEGVPVPQPVPGTRWPLLAAGAALVAVAVLIGTVARNAGTPGDRTDMTPRNPTPVATAPPAVRTHTGAWPPAEVGGNLLDITVLAEGRPVAGARVVVLRLERRPWHAWTYDPWRLHGRASTDAHGRAFLEAVPDGYVRVLAALDGHGRGETIAYLPEEFEEPVVVELPPERTVTVEAFDRQSRRPVAGAAVDVLDASGEAWLPELDVAPTRADGRTVVRGLGARTAARLRLRADAYAATGPLRVREILDVELAPRRRRVSWSITSWAPAERSPLDVRRIHAASGREGRVEAGRVVATGLPDGAIHELLAVAADGSFARLVAEPGSDEGPPVEFGRAPVLDVVLRDQAGTPAAGIDVRVVNDSGNPLYPAARSDANGRAQLAVYARDPVELQVRTSARAPFRTVRTYDPARGDVKSVVTLPRERTMLLRVRRDGEAGLPASVYDLYVGRTPVAPEEIEEQRALGHLRFRARAREQVSLHLLAPGYLPATVELSPGDTELDVDLISAGTLIVHVSAARNQPYRLALIGAADRGDLSRGPGSFRLHPGPDHVVRESMMPPGHFRVRDLTSGRATEEFFVLPGRGVVSVRLDLRDTWPPRRPEVRGVVAGLGDLELRDAAIVVVTADGSVHTVPVEGDGSFVFAWHGVVRVHAHHPRAERAAAAVTVTGARDDLVLMLQPRQRAFARLHPAPGPAQVGQTAPRVRLLAERQTVTLDAALDDGLRFAGFQPGHYAIWIDVAGFAPKTLPVAHLADGVSDLGVVTLERGTSLRFRILGLAATPELTIAAQALGSPPYQRSVRTRGKDAVALPGLGPGAFQVTAWERYSGLKVWSSRIEADGSNDLRLEIDLR